MCGIVGFCGKGSVEDLERMTAALEHRGPDEEGFHVDSSLRVYLGHRRLTIMDLESGAQPLWNEDSTVGVVFNGEIYNHRRLRRELESAGHVFQTDHCDTEVLVHAYEEWGPDFVKRLNGMWAFAIYDLRRRRFFLSRDRFGKKPLYYFHSKDLFLFASELSVLPLHKSMECIPDRLSLKKYYAYGFIPAPRSLYRGVYKLPAGHNLILDLNSHAIRVEPYWEFALEPFESIPRHPERTWAEELRHLLVEAVRRRLESDVPLGVYLSGGIDSTAVAAAAAHLKKPGKVLTFSIGFDEPSFDESAHARLAADFIGSEHHHERLSLARARDLVPGVLERLDEPIADGSIIPTYLLSRFTRSRVSVALSGDGGDELFAGYDPFKALRLAQVFEALIPSRLRNRIRSLADLLPVSSRNMSLDFRIKRALRGLDYARPYWNPIWLSPLEPAEIEELFQEETNIEELYSEAFQYWHESPHQDLVDRTLVFYTKLYLQDDILPKVDRTSMMVSLEVRSPLLDMELVDFVRRIPSGWKFRRGETKALFKQSLRDLVPDSIIDRAKKGFGIPLTQWLRDAWGEWAPASFVHQGARRFTERMAREHMARKADHRLFLWADIVLGAHMKRLNRWNATAAS